MPANYTDLEKKLWNAADQLWANSRLRPSEYSAPVLGLIFLRYADARFEEARREIEQAGEESTRRRRQVGKIDYQARGVMYVPEEARFSALQALPEGANVGQSIKTADVSCRGLVARSDAISSGSITT